jgi:hypothetical protein
MTTYTFREIAHTERRRVPCAGGCGKKLNRQRTFTNTVSPFNRHPDGTPRTPSEIYAHVKAEGAAWTPTATCTACADTEATS